MPINIEQLKALPEDEKKALLDRLIRTLAYRQQVAEHPIGARVGGALSGAAHGAANAVYGLLGAYAKGEPPTPFSPVTSVPSPESYNADDILDKPILGPSGHFRSDPRLGSGIGAPYTLGNLGGFIGGTAATSATGPEVLFGGITKAARTVPGLLGFASRAAVGSGEMAASMAARTPASTNERLSAAAHAAPLGAVFGVAGRARVAGESLSGYVLNAGLRASIASIPLAPLTPSPIPITGRPIIDAPLFNALFSGATASMHSAVPDLPVDPATRTAWTIHVEKAKQAEADLTGVMGRVTGFDPKTNRPIVSTDPSTPGLPLREGDSVPWYPPADLPAGPLAPLPGQGSFGFDLNAAKPTYLPKPPKPGTIKAARPTAPAPRPQAPPPPGYAKTPEGPIAPIEPRPSPVRDASPEEILASMTTIRAGIDAMRKRANDTALITKKAEPGERLDEVVARLFPDAPVAVDAPAKFDRWTIGEEGKITPSYTLTSDWLSYTKGTKLTLREIEANEGWLAPLPKIPNKASQGTKAAPAKSAKAEPPVPTGAAPATPDPQAPAPSQSTEPLFQKHDRWLDPKRTEWTILGETAQGFVFVDPKGVQRTMTVGAMVKEGWTPVPKVDVTASPVREVPTSKATSPTPQVTRLPAATAEDMRTRKAKKGLKKKINQAGEVDIETYDVNKMLADIADSLDPEPSTTPATGKKEHGIIAEDFVLGINTPEGQQLIHTTADAMQQGIRDPQSPRAQALHTRVRDLLGLFPSKVFRAGLEVLFRTKNPDRFLASVSIANNTLSIFPEFFTLTPKAQYRVLSHEVNHLRLPSARFDALPPQGIADAFGRAGLPTVVVDRSTHPGAASERAAQVVATGRATVYRLFPTATVQDHVGITNSRSGNVYTFTADMPDGTSHPVDLRVSYISDSVTLPDSWGTRDLMAVLPDQYDFPIEASVPKISGDFYAYTHPLEFVAELAASVHSKGAEVTGREIPGSIELLRTIFGHEYIAATDIHTEADQGPTLFPRSDFFGPRDAAFYFDDQRGPLGRRTRAPELAMAGPFDPHAPHTVAAAMDQLEKGIATALWKSHNAEAASSTEAIDLIGTLRDQAFMLAADKARTNEFTSAGDFRKTILPGVIEKVTAPYRKGKLPIPGVRQDALSNAPISLEGDPTKSPIGSVTHPDAFANLTARELLVGNPETIAALADQAATALDKATERIAATQAAHAALAARKQGNLVQNQGDPVIVQGLTTPRQAAAADDGAIATVGELLKDGTVAFNKLEHLTASFKKVALHFYGHLFPANPADPASIKAGPIPPENGWAIAVAARTLGMSESTVRRNLKALHDAGIDPVANWRSAPGRSPVDLEDFHYHTGLLFERAGGTDLLPIEGGPEPPATRIIGIPEGESARYVERDVNNRRTGSRPTYRRSIRLHEQILSPDGEPLATSRLPVAKEELSNVGGRLMPVRRVFYDPVTGERIGMSRGLFDNEAALDKRIRIEAADPVGAAEALEPFSAVNMPPPTGEQGALTTRPAAEAGQPAAAPNAPAPAPYAYKRAVQGSLADIPKAVTSDRFGAGARYLYDTAADTLGATGRFRGKQGMAEWLALRDDQRIAHVLQRFQDIAAVPTHEVTKQLRHWSKMLAQAGQKYPTLVALSRMPNKRSQLAHLFAEARKAGLQLEQRGTGREGSPVTWRFTEPDTERSYEATTIGNVAMLIDARTRWILAHSTHLTPVALDNIRIFMPDGAVSGGPPRKGEGGPFQLANGELPPSPSTEVLDKLNGGAAGKFRGIRSTLFTLGRITKDKGLVTAFDQLITATETARVRAASVWNAGMYRRAGALGIRTDEATGLRLGRASIELDAYGAGLLKTGRSVEEAALAVNAEAPSIYEAHGLSEAEQRFLSNERKSFWDPLFSRIGINTNRYIPGYISNWAKLSDTVGHRLSGLPEAELNFIGMWERTGEAANLEENYFKIAQGYARAGMRYKYLWSKPGSLQLSPLEAAHQALERYIQPGPRGSVEGAVTIPTAMAPLELVLHTARGIPDARKIMWSSQWRKFLDTTANYSAAKRADAMGEQLASEMQRPTRTLITRSLRKVYRKLGIDIHDNHLNNLGDIMLALHAGRTFGMNAMAIARNATGSLFTVLPRVGPRFYGEAIRELSSGHFNYWLRRTMAAGALTPSTPYEWQAERTGILHGIDTLMEPYRRVDVFDRVLAFTAQSKRTSWAVERYKKHGSIDQFREDSRVNMIHPAAEAIVLEPLQAGNHARTITEHARLLTTTALMDFSMANTPDAFRGVWGRLGFQYSRWNLAMTEQLVNTFRYATHSQRASVAGSWAVAAGAIYGLGQLFGVRTQDWIPFIHSTGVFGFGPLGSELMDISGVMTGQPFLSAKFKSDFHRDPEAFLLGYLTKNVVPGWTPIKALLSETNLSRRQRRLLGLHRFAARSRADLAKRILGFRPIDDPAPVGNAVQQVLDPLAEPFSAPIREATGASE